MQHTKDEVRRRIIEAAICEFDEKGYSGASMRAIVERSGSSLGNIYRYYPNKEKLFLSVVTPVLDECIGLTGRVFDISPDMVAHTAELMVDYVAEHNKIFRIIASGPPEHYADFLSRLSACISHRIRSYALQKVPERVEQISNPSFFDAVAAGGISSLSMILEHYENRPKTTAYLEELLRFQYGCFEERLRFLTPTDRA